MTAFDGLTYGWEEVFALISAPTAPPSLPTDGEVCVDGLLIDVQLLPSNGSTGAILPWLYNGTTWSAIGDGAMSSDDSGDTIRLVPRGNYTRVYYQVTDVAGDLDVWHKVQRR